MAIASELNVYRDFYRLTQYILIEAPKFPRIYKYTLGERMMNVSLECLKYIQLINVSYDKETRLNYFNLLIAEFESLKILCRLSSDSNIRCLSKNKFAFIVDLLSSIGKQITAWKKSSEKSIK